MKIKHATLHNWGPYRGTQTIELKPLVYGVVAQLDRDEERSNWIGKTMFLEALGPFGLFGKHRFDTEDEWISKGEREGGVELGIEGQSASYTIKRTRRIGGPTELVVGFMGRELKGDDAQKQIVELVGASWKDFPLTSFFKQKSMARFILEKPAERQGIVSEWLQLGPLQAAGKKAQLLFQSALGKYRAHAETVSALRAQLPATAKQEGWDRARWEQACEKAIADKRAEAEQVRASIKELQEADQIWREFVAKQDAWKREHDTWSEANKRRKANEQKLAALRIELSTLPLTTQVKSAAELAAAKEKHRTTLEEVRRLKVIAGGGFDGKCPVSIGFECPATQQINERQAANKAAFDDATKLERERHEAVNAALDANGKAADLDEERERLKDSIATLEGTLLVPLEPEPERPKDPAPKAIATYEVNRCEQLVRDAERGAAELEAELANGRNIYGTIAELEAEGVKLLQRVEIERAKSQILGRSGAQRRVAEQELRIIQSEANRSLRDAGVELSVRASWARPTQQLADACDQCGEPFPRTTRAKQCERCEAPRGPKMDERLDLELSDRSGAAEDLAGIAFQLAAAAWLRARRGSVWGVAYLDEPFGALDTAHQKSVASYLVPSLVGKMGYEQAFVVAHHRGIMAALPGQIRILGTPEGSKISAEG